MIRRLVRRIRRRTKSTESRPQTQSYSPVEAPPVEEEELPDIEVEGATVAQWRDSGRDVVFVDIREVHEINHGHIAGAVLLPMNQVPERINELPREQTLVVYCAAGVRSFGVSHYLREQGIADTWSLVGGIGAWIEQDEAAWHTPPMQQTLRASTPARLTPAAAKRLGRDGPLQNVAGSIQMVEKTPDGIRYTLSIPRQEGGVDVIEALSAADLQAG